jgi:hypothetical protein
MHGKGRIGNSTDYFSVMSGVAVLCRRRMLGACNDLFKVQFSKSCSAKTRDTLYKRKDIGKSRR